MVLRRCHLIVLSDAGQDGDFEFSDLGNAIRKIRIDLGIPITFDDGINIYPRAQKRNGYHCALGAIGYSKVDGDGTDGILVYIKPAFYGNEPRDIYQYAQSNQAFPHDPTADQWFDESQFESYRMLGAHVMERIGRYALGEPRGKDVSLAEFVKKVRRYLNHPPGS